MTKIKSFFNNINTWIKNFLFKYRYGVVMILIGLIVAFWDLTLKYLTDGKNLDALKGIFSIYSTHNTGGAWSIFSNATVFLIVLTIIMVVALLIFNFIYNKKSYFYAISLGLVLSGAICNLIDRLKFGYVRDFINLEFMKFPVFNIADIAICVGVVLICVHFIFLAPKMVEQGENQANDESMAFVQEYKVQNLNMDENAQSINNSKTKQKKSNKKSRSKNAK